MLAWLALLVAAPSLADPADALAPVPRRLFLEGRDLEADGRYAEAARRYEQVSRLDPRWTEAYVALGRAWEQAGEVERARRAYGRAPYDAAAVEALGRLLLEEEAWGEAEDQFRKLRDLRPDWPGAIRLHARAVAPEDASAAAELLRDYLSFHTATLDDEGVIETAAAVARTLHDEGRIDDAQALLEELVARFPEAEGAERIDELLVTFEVDVEARRLAEAVHVPLEPQQVERLVTAREAYARGELVASLSELEALRDEAPHNAVVWATLSDVLEALGDIQGAERAIGVAERLDPLEAAYPARLGDLLSEWFGGRFDQEAAEAYGRAVRRRSADAELWFRKGRAERRAGRWVRAQASFERVLALSDGGPLAEAARAQVEGAKRVRSPAAEIPPAPGRPDDVPEEAWLAFHRAWAWRERAGEDDGEALDRALEELEVARTQAPRFVRALNLEAAIRVDRGEREEARRLYRRSLEEDPDQDPVMVVLAELLRQDGELQRADALLDEAAALGNPDALWVQAREQADALRWWAARTTLQRYFARTTSAASYDDAVALDAALRRRINGTALGAVVGVVLVAGVPVWLRVRRRSGVGLGELLRRAPGTYRDVARIGSAIRHEVLKHNTTVLSGVADALEDGDPEPAMWAAEKLFSPRGAVARFRGYVGELTQLGRSHGVRLNLRWCDETFGPLIASMQRLASLEQELLRGGSARLAPTLRELSDQLNDDGYQALGRLLRRVCVLPLTESLLAGVYDEVRGEPAFRGRPRLPLRVELPDERIHVRLFRSDLEDILANLLRNSLEAALDADGERLGLAVALEADPITGLERVQLRVKDDSPRKLSTAMIRGRYIGRGLGLAVDLISRAGGSIHVEDEPGWSKAVVVRLPRAELPDDDDEEV